TLFIKVVSTDQKDQQFIQDFSHLFSSIEDNYQQLVSLKTDAIETHNPGLIEPLKRLSRELSEQLTKAISLSNQYSAEHSTIYGMNGEKINEFTFLALFVLGVASTVTTMLLIFLISSTSRAIVNPLNAIVDQIKLLNEGVVDLSRSQQLDIYLKDEIGMLAHELNGLITSIHGMNSFKKVIEADESLTDVYSRLGKSFEELGLPDYIIYEVLDSKLIPVGQEFTGKVEINCNEDILSNCDLCRAKRTSNVISSFDYPQICKQFRMEVKMEHICVPMIIGSSTGGVIQFLLPQNQEYNRSEVDRKIFRAKNYITESIHVIEAKRLMNTLKDSAIKDTLTGLYNRRLLQESGDSIVSGVLRRKKTLGLLMVDLDYFKQVNDTYGHDVGDQVLSTLAVVLKSSVRTSDIVIRFGGEEFLIILMDVEDGESLKIAEKIRSNIEKMEVKVHDGVLKKTGSIGLSEFPKDTDGFWQAIKYADISLYFAKESGRNRVIRFDQSMWKGQEF
ncbi:MAG: sensor domain-containing diguanylate cyclase, partial [SAR324 cluster bacterium]|nr:sensor domain-containing diguanylate cyclase [SAR324 cluster bacterium]